MTDTQSVNLMQLFEDFETDKECREFLEALRWPKGIECPNCQSPKISRIRERKQFDCDGCRYQFSATAGTIFHDSHLPLPKWFVAVYLMCESKKGISANQLKRTIKVSYKTAWYLCHRIRKAMTEARPEAVNHSAEKWLRGDVHTNAIEGVWSLFKRSLIGSYHQVSSKHLDAYLDEFEWRYNERKNRYLFRDTMLKLVSTQQLEFKKLIAKSA